MKGIGGHQRAYQGRTDEWLTPPEIIKALGPFDLDPCAPIHRPWDTAKQHYTIKDDGLAQEWAGNVWLNPPYGPETHKWLHKLSEHKDGGIALIFARTETDMFHRYVWKRAFGVFFFRSRLFFYQPSGIRAKNNAGGPSCLVAYGENSLGRIEKACFDDNNQALNGILIRLKAKVNCNGLMADIGFQYSTYFD
jgi:hypothetical protein